MHIVTVHRYHGIDGIDLSINARLFTKHVEHLRTLCLSLPANIFNRIRGTNFFAPIAQVALLLAIGFTRFICGADCFAFSAIEAFISVPQPEPAFTGNQRQYCSIWTEQAAEWPIDKDRDNNQRQEHVKIPRYLQMEEILESQPH